LAVRTGFEWIYPSAASGSDATVRHVYQTRQQVITLEALDKNRRKSYNRVLSARGSIWKIVRAKHTNIDNRRYDQ